MTKQLVRYFKQHPYQNSAAHLLIGLGLGILVSRPWFGLHPIRWGLTFLIAGGILHLYPLMMEKKSKK